MGYVTLDANGTVREANLAATALLGCERHRFIGQTLSMFIAPVSQGEYDSFLRRLLAGESGVRFDARLGANTKRQGWVLLDGGAFVGGKARQPGRLTITDITERKIAEEMRVQVEEALRESEERFRATFDQAAVGIGHVAPDGSWLLVNRKYCDIVGYPEAEIRKLSFKEITHPDDRETSMEHFRLMMEGKLGSYSLEKRYIRKDGSIVWVTLTASMVTDTAGKPKFVVGIIEDITSRKRAEEEIERLNTDLAARATELETANHELEAFNYTVAHDLRKPLTVINSYCQVIKELCGDKLDEKCLDYLREGYEGTLRMNALIDALLNFSRLTHIEPRREAVDLSTMVQEVASELKLAEPSRRATFRIAEGVTVEGDAKLLRVALDNLLGNAWKYTGAREEAVIEFGVADIDDKPACFVRDNGQGFAMADAEKLFIPFRRLPGADEFKGFGIGLATVERIIRRHGGRVWAESAPGKGATFWFTLPPANQPVRYFEETPLR